MLQVSGSISLIRVTRAQKLIKIPELQLISNFAGVTAVECADSCRGELTDASTPGTITFRTQIEVWGPDGSGLLILSFGSQAWGSVLMGKWHSSSILKRNPDKKKKVYILLREIKILVSCYSHCINQHNFLPRRISGGGSSRDRMLCSGLD
jgi:hypothetical protein